MTGPHKSHQFLQYSPVLRLDTMTSVLVLPLRQHRDVSPTLIIPNTSLLPRPAAPIPTSLPASMMAWITQSSSKTAILAQERLLTRLPSYSQAKPQAFSRRSSWWSSVSSPSSVTRSDVSDIKIDPPPLCPTLFLGNLSSFSPIVDNALQASIREIFVPTPNPSLAPAHPCHLASPD